MTTLEDAQRAMRSLVGAYPHELSSREEIEESVWNLCQNHPSLALESFEYLRNDGGEDDEDNDDNDNENEVIKKMTPLVLFIHEGMELTSIQKFCRAFPEAVQQKDEESGNYPVHMACTLAHRQRHPIQEGLISFLVKLFPTAASTKNLQGNLPLHLLLLGSSTATNHDNIHNDNHRGDTQLQRNNTISSTDVQALVECYPYATVMTSVAHNTTPLDGVLETSHYFSQAVRDVVCSHVPDRVRFYQLGRQRQQSLLPQINTRPRTAPIAKALSQLLPQLIVLECKRTDWDLDGWALLLRTLAVNTSIRCLSLTMPHNLLSSATLGDEGDNTARGLLLDPLQNFVASNKGMTRLSLIHRPQDFDIATGTSSMMTCQMDFTAVIQQVLETNRIQSLTLVGIPFDMKALYQAVSTNTSLVEWNLEGCGNHNNHQPLTTTTTAFFCRSTTSVDFSQLTRILQRHNTSLQKVVIPCHPSTSSTRHHCRSYDLLYWTALNRFGRKHVRKLSTNLEQMIALLATLRHQRYIIQQGFRVEMYQVRYGLLRESPSLWCR